VHPLDVVRRRMQAASPPRPPVYPRRSLPVTLEPFAQLAADAEGSLATGRIWPALRTMVRQEGAAALFAGLGPTLLKVVPSAGVSLATVVAALNFFRRMNAA
jgi:hypothetical protein